MSFDNQHYISKCLTKPWENKDKELVYFDFATNKIERQTSENLFARKHLWPKHFEKYFSKMFERMVEHVRNLVTTGDGDVRIAAKHWRAVYALLAIHIQRGVHALGNNPGNQFTLLENRKFFQVLHLFAREYQAIRIPCPNQYLAFPESTIYPLPVKVGTDWKIGYAISITPTYAIGFVPHGWLKPEMKKVCQLFLSGLSIGIGDYARRVVLCPELVEAKGEAFLIEKMAESRGNAEELLQMIVSGDRTQQMHWEVAVNAIWECMAP